MATVNFTSLLGLALPTSGDLSGTWGDEINDKITSLLDSAVAGATPLTTDANVTLTTTTGAANTARQAILLCTGARTTVRTITAPATSKLYVIINATTGGHGVKIVGAGPTTGITIATGDVALVAWNGSDFVFVGAAVSAPQTLLNKTLNLTSNTLSGTKAQFNTACFDGDFVYTDAIGSTVQGYDALTAKAGKQTIWIPAGALTARTTGGAAAGTAETATNKVMIKTLDFDQSTQEHAQFTVRMPKSWNEGTVTATFLWSSAVSGTNAVVWGAQGVALSDDDALDAAFGTAQTVTDAQTVLGDLMQTAETSAITINGTPAAGDLVVFQFYRDAANGADTLAGDARLHGVTIFYTTDAANDA